jgi:magnesium-transporting ATPase (P-type)
LTLLGLVGLIDPPRMEAKAAVARCQEAGIEVAMVTGDHPLTALSIARELGIVRESETGNKVVTGRALEEAGDPQSESFRGLVREARVFARVAPLQKLQRRTGAQAGQHWGRHGLRIRCHQGHCLPHRHR